MCGIVGYIGDKEAAPLLLEGLNRLEYRGYDSAGIAVYHNGDIDITKKQGKLEDLNQEVEGDSPRGVAGIGHTRWATHGRPSDVNSHPHYGNSRDFVLVHNGIIENYRKLKEELQRQGHQFRSETDTEVIAHQLEELYRGDLREAVIDLIELLEGSYALAIISRKQPDRLLAVRKDSPLIIGLGQGENYIASDIPAFLQYTRQFYILEDGEIAEVTDQEIELYDETGRPIQKDIFEVNWNPEQAEKNGYDHYMLKEIHEQPDALRRFLKGRVSPEGVNLEELELTPGQLAGIERIQIVACGTAYHSGLIGKYVIEELSGIPVEVDVASEFRYREPLIDEKTLVIVVSQSGETADTLAGLRLAQKKGARVLALTNVVGSSIPREADNVLYLKAGPEIAVASTKAYLVMLAAFYLLALYLGKTLDTLASDVYNELLTDLLRLPDLITRVIRENQELIEERSREYGQREHAFFIGRNTDYTLALEGALKLKEISYIHAEAYPAGELKHGTLALIEDGVPVVAIATRDRVYDKMISNIKEVKARGGSVLALVSGDSRGIEEAVDHVIVIPEISGLFSGVLTIVPLQLLAYYTALRRGCDIDQPRNLAKSVTVE